MRCTHCGRALSPVEVVCGDCGELRPPESFPSEEVCRAVVPQVLLWGELGVLPPATADRLVREYQKAPQAAALSAALRDRLGRLEELLGSGKWQQALEQAEAVLRSQPRLFPALEASVQALEALGRPEDAADDRALMARLRPRADAASVEATTAPAPPSEAPVAVGAGSDLPAANSEASPQGRRSWAEGAAAFLEAQDIRYWHVVGTAVLLTGLVGLVLLQGGVLGRAAMAAALTTATAVLLWLGARLRPSLELSGRILTLLAGALVPLDIVAANRVLALEHRLETAPLGLACGALCAAIYFAVLRRWRAEGYDHLTLGALAAATHFALQAAGVPEEARPAGFAALAAALVVLRATAPARLLGDALPQWALALPCAALALSLSPAALEPGLGWTLRALLAAALLAGLVLATRSSPEAAGPSAASLLLGCLIALLALTAYLSGGVWHFYALCVVVLVGAGAAGRAGVVPAEASWAHNSVWAAAGCAALAAGYRWEEVAEALAPGPAARQVSIALSAVAAAWVAAVFTERAPRGSAGPLTAAAAVLGVSSLARAAGIPVHWLPPLLLAIWLGWSSARRLLGAEAPPAAEQGLGWAPALALLLVGLGAWIALPTAPERLLPSLALFAAGALAAWAGWAGIPARAASVTVLLCASAAAACGALWGGASPAPAALWAALAAWAAFELTLRKPGWGRPSIDPAGSGPLVASLTAVTCASLLAASSSDPSAHEWLRGLLLFAPLATARAGWLRRDSRALIAGLAAMVVSVLLSRAPIGDGPEGVRWAAGAFTLAALVWGASSLVWRSGAGLTTAGAAWYLAGLGWLEASGAEAASGIRLVLFAAWLASWVLTTGLAAGSSPEGSRSVGWGWLAGYGLTALLALVAWESRSPEAHRWTWLGGYLLLSAGVAAGGALLRFRPLLFLAAQAAPLAVFVTLVDTTWPVEGGERAAALAALGLAFPAMAWAAARSAEWARPLLLPLAGTGAVYAAASFGTMLLGAEPEGAAPSVVLALALQSLLLLLAAEVAARLMPEGALLPWTLSALRWAAAAPAVCAALALAADGDPDWSRALPTALALGVCAGVTALGAWWASAGAATRAVACAGSLCVAMGAASALQASEGARCGVLALWSALWISLGGRPELWRATALVGGALGAALALFRAAEAPGVQVLVPAAIGLGLLVDAAALSLRPEGRPAGTAVRIGSALGAALAAAAWLLQLEAWGVKYHSLAALALPLALLLPLAALLEQRLETLSRHALGSLSAVALLAAVAGAGPEAAALTMLAYGCLFGAASGAWGSTAYAGAAVAAWTGAWLYGVEHLTREGLAVPPITLWAALGVLWALLSVLLERWEPGEPWGEAAGRFVRPLRAAVVVAAAALGAGGLVRTLAGAGPASAVVASWALVALSLAVVGLGARDPRYGHGASLFAFGAYFLGVLDLGVTAADAYLLPLGGYLVVLGLWRLRAGDSEGSQPLLFLGLLSALGSTALSASQEGGAHGVLLLFLSVGTIALGMALKHRLFAGMGSAFLALLLWSKVKPLIVNADLVRWDYWPIYAVLLGAAILAAALLLERRERFAGLTKGLRDELERWH